MFVDFDGGLLAFCVSGEAGPVLSISDLAQRCSPSFDGTNLEIEPGDQRFWDANRLCIEVQQGTSVDVEEQTRTLSQLRGIEFVPAAVQPNALIEFLNPTLLIRLFVSADQFLHHLDGFKFNSARAIGSPIVGSCRLVILGEDGRDLRLQAPYLSILTNARRHRAIVEASIRY